MSKNVGTHNNYVYPQSKPWTLATWGHLVVYHFHMP
jgi:hypothetical protein